MRKLFSLVLLTSMSILGIAQHQANFDVALNISKNDLPDTPFQISTTADAKSVIIAVGNDSTLTRKRASVVLNNETILSKQQLSVMLNQEQFDLYKIGRQKIFTAIPLYAISASSLFAFGYIERGAILQKSYSDSQRNPHDPSSENPNEHYFVIPPIWIAAVGLVPLALSVSTGCWAIKRTQNGMQMIDDLCLDWNDARKMPANNLSMSFTVCPNRLGLILNF